MEEGDEQGTWAVLEGSGHEEYVEQWVPLWFLPAEVMVMGRCWKLDGEN